MRALGRRRGGVLAVGVIAAGAVAVGAVAGPRPVDGPPTVSSMATGPHGRPDDTMHSSWPVNARGQTYGDPESVSGVVVLPDLVVVAAGNGRLGYVDRALVDEVTGANVATPAEARAWQRRQDATGPQPSLYVPVYESDGTTQVGTFEISRSGRSTTVPPDHPD